MCDKVPRFRVHIQHHDFFETYHYTHRELVSTTTVKCTAAADAFDLVGDGSCAVWFRTPGTLGNLGGLLRGRGTHPVAREDDGGL